MKRDIQPRCIPVRSGHSQTQGKTTRCKKHLLQTRDHGSLADKVGDKTVGE